MKLLGWLQLVVEGLENQIFVRRLCDLHEVLCYNTSSITNYCLPIKCIRSPACLPTKFCKVPDCLPTKVNAFCLAMFFKTSSGRPRTTESKLLACFARMDGLTNIAIWF